MVEYTMAGVAGAWFIRTRSTFILFFTYSRLCVWCGRRRYTYTGTDIHAWGHAAK